MLISGELPSHADLSMVPRISGLGKRVASENAGLG